jgi:hypothetical protein
MSAQRTADNETSRGELRCHACKNGADHYDHGLRAAIAAAIQDCPPNASAEWWIGPEYVLNRVEDYLNRRGNGGTGVGGDSR